MVRLQTKNPNLGKFWRVLQWKMLVYFMDTWSILRSFVIFYGHLVHFTVFCCILWIFGIVCCNLAYFPRFGILYQEKSGNPEIALIIEPSSTASSSDSRRTPHPLHAAAAARSVDGS
jgi:hypothetical protein